MNQLICAFAVAKARGRKLHSKVSYEVARLESSSTFVGGQRRGGMERGVTRGNDCGEDRTSSQQGDSSNDEDVPEIEDGSDSSTSDEDSSGEGDCSGRGKGTDVWRDKYTKVTY